MSRQTTTLPEAVRHLYETAVVAGARTSTKRLDRLAEYCVAQLHVRGLEGAETEVSIPGGGRPKRWDVAWQCHGKYRLALSLKSLLRNLGGTVPNRIDDLVGEVANVQLYSPEIVVGYVMLFDAAQDAVTAKHGCTWCELLSRRLSRLSGRRPPYWSAGMVEAFTVVQVDFSEGPTIITPEQTLHSMFDLLVAQVKERNPALSDTEATDA